MGPQMTILAVLTTLFLFSGSAVSQISYAPCTTSTYNWANNSLNQNPCEVAAYMEGTCNQGVFTVDPLLPGNEYFGPSGVDNSNLCKCSTVAYSLVSACAACQEAEWITWSEWVTNCTKVFETSGFPNPVPDGTSLPQWALLDVTLENSWSPNKSQTTGNTPEIPAGAFVSPTSSSTRPAGATRSASPTSTVSPESRGKSSNTGPIVGGVVAGIAVVAVAVLGFFYLRRRRTRSQYAAPPSSFGADDDTLVFGGEPQPHRGAIKPPSSDDHYTSSSVPASPMRMYNPNDPTTFPNLQTASYTPSASPRAIYGPQPGTGNPLANMQVTRPQGYHGLPTV